MDGSPIHAAARIAGRSFQSFSQATGAVLETLEERFPRSGLVVAQLDYEENEYRVLDVRGDERLGVEAGMTLALDASLCFHMAEGAAPRRCDDAAADPVYGRLDMQRARGIGSYVGVPLELSDGTHVGSLCAVASETSAYEESDLELLTVMGRMLAHEWERVKRERELRRLRSLLRDQDVTDPVTGVADRDRFLASLEREWHITRRANISSYVVALSLPGLSSVVERLGPAMGDLLLKDVARALAAVARNTDVVGRVDADHFGVVLVHCHGEDGAAAFCQRLRTTLARLSSDRAASVQPAFGVCALGDAASHTEALESAVQAAGTSQRAAA